MDDSGPAPGAVPGAAFDVGPWRVEPGLNRLWNREDGRAVALEPRALDVLVVLARSAGETVSKQRLLEEAWRGAFVVEGVVPKTVFALRQALGDSATAPRYILTVPRRGYRLVAPVRWIGAEEPADAPVALPPAGPVTAARRRFRFRWRLAAALALLALVAGVAARRAWLRATAASGLPPLERLAVAPFEGAGGDEAALALASAIRSEVVGELVRLSRPRVVLVEPSQTAGRGVLAAAREAGAEALLSGQVRAGAGSVRADLRLAEVPTGALLWSVSVERPAAELLDLRRLLAGEVLERVTGAPAGRRPAPGETMGPIAPATYREFLEARFLWSRRGASDIERAHALLTGIARDAPAFAEGHAWLALAEVTRANYLGAEPGAAFRAAEREARRALELDPGDPVGHVAAGLVALNLRLAAGEAVASYRRAIALAPSFAPAWQLLAEALSVSQAHEEAVAAADEAVALEPFSPLMHGVRGLVLHAAGRPAEAIEACDRALVLDPRFTWVHRYRAYALIRLGRGDEAAQAFLAELGGAESRPEVLARFATAIRARGLAGYWETRLAWLTDLRARGFAPRSSQLAEALAAAGRDEEALDELDRATRRFDGEYFLHYRTSPAFDHLRSDPRFRSIYGRVGG